MGAGAAGLDEVAALVALLDASASDETIVLDAAPTGHFLRLLEMPQLALDWTRQILRLMLKYGVAGAGANAAEALLRLARELRALGELLRDPDRAGTLLVTLPEPVVAAETERLRQRLDEARRPRRCDHREPGARPCSCIRRSDHCTAARDAAGRRARLARVRSNVEHRDVSDVVYLYGFVPPDASGPPDHLRGVRGAPVTLLDMGETRAAVSHLSDPEFRAERVEERLGDLAWVGEQGLAHERVVAWFVDHTDILPAQLFSMHSSENALRERVTGSVARLADRLRAFAGRREWDLKVAYDAAVLQQHGPEISPELRALAEEIASAPPGRKYLLERKRADLLKREVRYAAKRLADELLDALAEHAVAKRVLPLSQDPASGAVVLTAALLVERTKDAALQREAATRLPRLTSLGMLVGFSGPWAPYRFVEQDGNA